jgi:hypothetical protein
VKLSMNAAPSPSGENGDENGIRHQAADEGDDRTMAAEMLLSLSHSRNT